VNLLVESFYITEFLLFLHYGVIAMVFQYQT